jgi:hypothetical protein
LGLLFQLHYFTIVVGWWWGWSWLQLTNVKSRVRHATVFVLGFVLPNLTFVLFELRHRFFLSHIVMESLFGGGKQQLVQPSLLQMVLLPIWFTGENVQRVLLYLVAHEWVSWGAGVILLCSLCVRLFILMKRRVNTLEIWFLLSWCSLVLLGSIMPTLIDEYYAAPLWFLVLWYVALAVKRVIRMRSVFGYVLIGVVMSWGVLRSPLFMQPNWSAGVPEIRAVADIIAHDVQHTHVQFFNIAAFTDSDTKGVRYRYFLDVAGVAPQDKDTYQGVPVLYVIAREPWGVLRERDVWETSAFTHGSAAVLGTIQDVTVYRVQKE